MATRKKKILNMEKTYKINIIRYNPETGKFKTESYKVKTEEKTTVLEALHIINKVERAGISYRFSCGMGVCGSCGAVVNGKPVLLCQTFCRDLKQPIEIRPLKNFPIIKDLVVDMDSAFNKLRTAMPYTDFVMKNSSTKTIQTQKQRELIDQTSQCIKCMLCYSVCPAYGINDKFIGPASASTAYKYFKDNRDKLKEERINEITKENGIFSCTHVGECSKVCPTNVDPNKAMSKLKLIGTFNEVKSIIRKKK